MGLRKPKQIHGLYSMKRKKKEKKEGEEEEEKKKNRSLNKYLSIKVIDNGEVYHLSLIHI